MTCTELYEWMEDPTLLTKSSLQELRQMLDEYPYFHAVRMLYLKNLAVIQDIRFEKELKKMAVYIPDRRLLFKLINERKPAGNDTIAPDTAGVSESRTDMVIETIEKAIPPDEPYEKEFIETFASKPISPAVATTDYANWLAHHTEDLPTEEGTENRLMHQDLIDSFIAIERSQLAQRLSQKEENKSMEMTEEHQLPTFDPMEKNSLDDSYFTETLARVYVSQKRYDKALEIIRVLSLKYPKKNIYFADQIRYLETLINIKK